MKRWHTNLRLIHEKGMLTTNNTLTLTVTIFVYGGTWRVNQKVEQPNIIAKKCKIEILGKRNFWQGPEMGIGRCWQVGKIKLFTKHKRKLRKKHIIIKKEKKTVIILKWFSNLANVKILNLTAKRFRYDVTCTPFKRWDSEANKEVFVDDREAIWQLGKYFS